MGIFLWMDVSHCSGCESRSKSRRDIMESLKSHQKHYLDVNHNTNWNRERKNPDNKGKKVRNTRNSHHNACWRRNGFGYCAVAAVAIACYINAIWGDFVHDDIPAIVQNRDVTGETSLLQVFRNDFWGTAMSDPSSHKSYRPLTTLSFRATHAAVGMEPPLFHVCNILLHVTASLLFTRVCLATVGFQPPFAAIAGVLFAVHPVHTEAVTGIVGRADVLACVFFLLSFLAYHGNKSKASVWGSIVLAALAMLAKETGIVVLLVNLVYDLYQSWRAIKRTVVELKWNDETLRFSRRAAKVLVSLSFLLVCRLALLQGTLPRFSNQDNPAAFHPCRHVRFLTFCYLAALNCWLLVFPATLSHDWQMGSVPLVTSLADSRNLSTCLFFACLLVLIYKGIVDFEYHKHPPLVLGILLLVLPFLPASNIAVTVGFVVAERVLYIPSAGWSILVVYGLQLVRWRQRTTLYCTMAVVAVFCARSTLRNRDWTSRENLVLSGLSALPHNAKMHYNYANCLRDQGDSSTARRHYVEALRLWPTYASAHNNLGTLMQEPGDAERHFLAAIRYHPHHVNAHYNLGQVYRKANRTAEAVRMLDRCVALDQTYTPAYELLARIHAQLGRIRTADLLLRRVVELNPNNADYLTEYGAFMHRRGMISPALELYLKALAVRTSHKSALQAASQILRSRGQLIRVHQLQHRCHISSRAGREDIYLRAWATPKTRFKLHTSRWNSTRENSSGHLTRTRNKPSPKNRSLEGQQTLPNSCRVSSDLPAVQKHLPYGLELREVVRNQDAAKIPT